MEGKINDRRKIDPDRDTSSLSAVESHGSGSSDPAYPTNEITAVHLEAKCKSWMEPLWLGDVDALLKQVAS